MSRIDEFVILEPASSAAVEDAVTEAFASKDPRSRGLIRLIVAASVDGENPLNVPEMAPVRIAAAQLPRFGGMVIMGHEVNAETSEELPFSDRSEYTIRTDEEHPEEPARITIIRPSYSAEEI